MLLRRIDQGFFTTTGVRGYMAFVFSIEKESIKRKFAVYVVIAKAEADTKLYVGKTGDNRDGCNPLISRCGNHFSYNDTHSQIRNRLEDHEERSYKYVFDHFDDYSEDDNVRRYRVARINEMERWLNEEIQVMCKQHSAINFLNAYAGVGHVASAERDRRRAYRTDECRQKIGAIVAAVRAEIDR
jgi:hypothetical protein